MKFSNYVQKINFIIKIYYKYHFIVSSLIFIILSLTFLNFDIINNEHKWLDGREYVARAESINLFEWDFLGLRDGGRTPLFPIVLYILSFLPFDIVIVYKILNIFFVVFIPSILIQIFKDLDDEKYKEIFTITAVLYYFFVPNYFFIDFVYAELISIFFFNFLIFFTYKIYLKKDFVIKNFFLLAFLFVICFYLKANLILYGLVFSIFLNQIFKNFKNLFLFGCIIFVLMSPWFLYMYSITGELKATNTQHVNRLFGMGLDTIGSGRQNLDTMHGKYIYKVYGENKEMIEVYNLYRNNMDEEYLTNELLSMDLNLQLEREKYSKISVKKIFNNDPNIILKYSLLKLPHLFGFSFRGLRDILIFVYSIISFLIMIYFIKQRKYKIFILINSMVLLATIIQTLIYVPTIRYSIYFFNSSIILYALMLFELKKKLIDKNEID